MASAADPLADALLYLAAHHGRSISRDALLAGLPIIDGKLNASLLERAARKAGLEIEPVKRSLADIPALVLPALLTMQDGTTRVLLDIDHELNKAVGRRSRQRQARPKPERWRRSRRIISATRSWCGRPPMPTPARSPPATCRRRIGSGRWSRVSAPITAMSRSPPS